jgi:hypothetical protein
MGIPIRPVLSLLASPRESLQLSDNEAREAHLHRYCNYELSEILYLPLPNFYHHVSAT